MDRSKVAQSDSAVVSKMGDRKFTMEQQIENNFTKVGKINQSVQSVMSKTRMIAEGKANAEEALTGAFDRLVNRAFSMAQANDVQAREMKAALSNLGGDIEGYAQAKEPTAKSEFKKKAEANLRMAKVQSGSLANALKKSKEEIDGALNSMPKNVVHRQNLTFIKLFTELDKALKAFVQDGELLQKEGQWTKGLEIESARWSKGWLQPTPQWQRTCTSVLRSKRKWAVCGTFKTNLGVEVPHWLWRFAPQLMERAPDFQQSLPMTVMSRG